ncbi:hypothetical protein GCM10027346_13110 [Hymenobacter seoulensis]
MEFVENSRWQEAVQHLLAVHRPEQAEQLVRRRLASHPEEAAGHELLGLVLLHQPGRHAEALTAVRQAISLDPQQPDPHYFHSVALLRNEQPFEALRAIEEALRLNPRSASLFGHKAVILNTLTRYEEALAATKLGLYSNPSHKECLFQRIRALRNLHQPEAAALTIGQLLRWYPTLALAHYLQGEEELHQSQLTAAEAHFREAMRLGPTDERAKKKLLPLLVRLGQQAQAEGELRQARAYFLQAWHLEPTYPEARQGIEQLAKRTFWLKRQLLRFDDWATTIQEQARQRQLKGWLLLLLVLCPIIAFGCLPLILLHAIAAVQWRRHPDVRMLDLYVSPLMLAWRILLVILVGLGCLALVIGFRLWLDTQSREDIAALFLLVAFVVSIVVWFSKKETPQLPFND